MRNLWSKIPAKVLTWLKILVPLLIVLVVIASCIIGWIASGKALTVNPQKVTYDQTITAINGNSYTLSGSAYTVDGLMGGIRSDGSMIGVFDAPTAKDDTTKSSTRVLPEVTGSPLKVGDTISLQGNIWTTNPKDALGLNYQTITYTNPFGSMSAWVIPPANAAANSTSSKWTIGVHGVGGDKNEMLRFVKPVIATGNTMMVINYRNDVDNPQTADGYYHLGDTEWQDLQSAIRYAQQHGATDISLYGDSLGGSTVENYLRRSSEIAKANITHVILDSPALDWAEISRNQITRSGYPSFVYYPTKLAIYIRARVNLDRISTKPSDIQQKTLIFHNANDQTVPPGASKRIAAARPDKVTLVDFGTGGHLRAWNHDPIRYEHIVSNFLSN